MSMFRSGKLLDQAGKILGEIVGAKIDLHKATSEELSAFLSLYFGKNTTFSGKREFSSSLSFSTYKGLSTDNRFLIQLINMLTNWNYARWEYNGLPEGVTAELIEDRLFTWGNCVIWRQNGQFYVSSFMVKQFNYNGYPLKIKPIMANQEQTRLTPVLTIGENCSVIWHDKGLLWMKSWWGPLWRVMPLFEDIAYSYSQISNSKVLLNQKLLIPGNASDETEAKINAIMSDTSRVAVRWGSKNSGMNESMGSIKANEKMLTFQDNQATLWDDLNNYLDMLKRTLGMSSNQNVKKKEKQIVAEVNIGNVESDSVNKACEMMRQKGIEEMNKVFGTNASVKLDEQQQQMNQAVNSEKEDVKNDKQQD